MTAKVADHKIFHKNLLKMYWQFFRYKISQVGRCLRLRPCGSQSPDWRNENNVIMVPTTTFVPPTASISTQNSGPPRCCGNQHHELPH